MSTPQNAGGGPPAKKSNTWIIVLIVVAVLAIPTLCVCGGFGSGMNSQNNQRPRRIGIGPLTNESQTR